MSYEIQVSTDVTEANEPLLSVVRSEGNPYIKEYMADDLSDADDYALVKKMCIAARVACEDFTGLALAEKTLIAQYSSDYVQTRGRRISLHFPPHRSMTSVYTVDMQGTETELALNGGYYKYGKLKWEIEFAQIIGTINAITSALDYKLTYVCGYGSNTMTLPEDLRMAMAQQVADWYKNRENWIPALSSHVKTILWRYRRFLL
jgi:uncharacterized phiE125 gp8 family phage protein